MTKVLTVTVPAYNVESYLKQALDSLAAPEIMPKIEVIVVNDGSTDATERIAGEYEKKYPQTFRVISKENGGHGSGINKGIQLAAGKYFRIIDGDDWVRTEDFAELVRLLESCDEDVVLTNCFRVDDKSGAQRPIFPTGILYDHPYKFEEISEGRRLGLSRMTVKTELLQRNHIRLDEHRYYVDMEYISYPVPYIQSVIFLNLYVYMYRVGREGQSVQIGSMKRHLQDHDDVLFRMIDFLNHYVRTPCVEEKKAIYITNLITDMISTQMTIYLNGKADRKMKNSIKEFEERVKGASKRVYDAALSHKKVRLLRRSHYRLCRLLSLTAKFYAQIGWRF